MIKKSHFVWIQFHNSAYPKQVSRVFGTHRCVVDDPLQWKLMGMTPNMPDSETLGPAEHDSLINLDDNGTNVRRWLYQCQFHPWNPQRLRFYVHT